MPRPVTEPLKFYWPVLAKCVNSTTRPCHAPPPKAKRWVPRIQFKSSLMAYEVPVQCSPLADVLPIVNPPLMLIVPIVRGFSSHHIFTPAVQYEKARFGTYLCAVRLKANRKDWTRFALARYVSPI